jgi:hypothetical protein
VPVPLVGDPDVAQSATKALSIEPFNLSSFERLPGGPFRLRFDGALEAKYIIEASTNPVDWVSLGQVGNVGGKLEFTDSDAPHFTLHFTERLGRNNQC